MGNTFGETATEAIEALSNLSLSGSLDVAGDIFSSSSLQTTGVFSLKDGNGNTTNAWYDGGPGFVNTLRNYQSDSTLWVIRSQAGDPEADNRESTLACTRTDDAGKTEVLDLYNNGFHGSGGSSDSIGHDGDNPVSVGHGIRVQKRGGSFLREFMFDWYDGSTRTAGYRILSPDQAEGPSMYWEGNLPFKLDAGNVLAFSELGNPEGSAQLNARNLNFADGVINYDDGTGSLSVSGNSVGISSVNRVSAGIWRVVLTKGSSPPDIVPSVGPGLPIWVSGSSRRESPQWSWEQDPDGDNPQEVEVRFEVSDDVGNTTLVDPERIAFKATVMN